MKTCPLETCKEILDFKVFKKYLFEPDYKIYENFLLNTALLRANHLCPCPDRKCDYIMKSENLNKFNFREKPTNIKCKCGVLFCNICREDTHTPLSCK